MSAAPVVQAPAPGIVTLAYYLTLLSAYWIAAAVALAFVALRRRPGMEGLIASAAVLWLVLRALGAILRLLIPCIAVDAEASFGFVVALVLAYILPLRLWQRVVCLVIVGLAAATRAYALQCQLPVELALAAGIIAFGALVFWLLNRFSPIRRRIQRLGLAIDNWGSRRARVSLTPEVTAVLAARLQQHLGFTVAEMRPLGADGVHASTPVIVHGTTADGEAQQLFAKIVTWGHWRSSIIFEALSALQSRDRGRRGPLWPSLKWLVGYEHYMLLFFRDLGVPVPRPRGLFRLARGVYVLVSDYLEGSTPLRGARPMPAAYVAEALQALRRLRDADCAHRDIKASNLLVLPGNHFALVDLALAEFVAGPQRQARDLADMLVVLSMHHEPEAVVAQALALIGGDGLRQARRYLHRSRLNVETQKMVPLELPGELRRLITHMTRRPSNASPPS